MCTLCLDAPELLETVTATDEGPSEQASKSEIAECFHSLIADLPDKQGETLNHIYFEGLTCEETAVMMSAPLNTVKSWSRRGVARLRELVGNLN